MKLKDLTAATGVPASSIKFYLRHGLLHAGEKLNATTARYGHDHVERLELIKVLRHVIGLSLEDCSRVVTAVNASESFTTAALMGRVQTVILDFLGDGSVSNRSTEEGTFKGPGRPDSLPPREGARLTAEDIVDAMGWLAGTDESMEALDQELNRMAGWGMAPRLDTALVYARAVDGVAAHQLNTVRSRGTLRATEHTADGRAAEDHPVSRDQLAQYVALGVYSHSRFMLKLLAVAQGAHARSGREEPSEEGPDRPRGSQTPE